MKRLERRAVCAGTVAAVLLAVTTASQVVARGDAYLRCKGTITVYYESGLQSLENEEIFAHVMHDRINFSGNHLLLGWDIRICRKSSDEFYFDSQSCKEGGPVDLLRPRQYGTLNKVTGELNLGSEIPKEPFAEGSFACHSIQPVIK
jgi:hypothetical protein